jgi:hypothetical protein
MVGAGASEPPRIPPNLLDVFARLRDFADLASLGVIVVGAQGAVLGMNAAASRILEEADGLGLIGRSLTSSGAAEAKALSGHLSEAIEGGPYHALPPYTALSIARPSGRMPYLILIAPLAEGVEASASRLALVLVRDLERHAAASAGR